MRLRDLESALQELSTFESPVAELEQYPTSAHLAAHVAHTMHATYDDVEGKRVADLGCGTGMLSAAVALMGATDVTGFDIDESVLAIAADNAREMELSIDLCQVDLAQCEFLAPKRGRVFDTVVMNPPFGTKRRGIDIAFLQTAVQICSGAVYSMHKSSTRDFVRRKAKEWGAHAQVLAELRFDIGRMYCFHKSESIDVEVDFWRIDVSSVSTEHVFAPVVLPQAGPVISHPASQKNRAKREEERAVGQRGRGRGKKLRRKSRGRG